MFNPENDFFLMGQKKTSGIVLFNLVDQLKHPIAET